MEAKSREIAQSSSRVAVVGAGIAGLACAHRLAGRGFQVTVFEALPAVGGRMASRWTDGILFDLGANFLAESYVTTRDLAAEVGVRLTTPGRVRHVFFREGRYHTMNLSSLGDLVSFGGLPWRSRLRALWMGLRLRFFQSPLDYFDLTTLPDGLLDGSAYESIRAEAGRDFADYIVDAFTSCMMFHRSAELSRGVCLALMQTMLDPEQSFQILVSPEGMAALPRALAQSASLRLDEAVRRVKREPGSVRIITDSSNACFDAAVVAVPAPVARAILDPLMPAEADVLSAVHYSSTINVSLVVSGPLPAAHHCFYLPWRESQVVSEFTNESIKGPDFGTGNRTTIDVGLHEAAARRMMSWTDGQIIDEIMHEMGRFLGPLEVPTGELKAHDLHRWPRALPKYDATLIRAVREFGRRDHGHGNVFFCGDWMAAPWVEGAARSGLRTARQVEDRIRGRLPAPPQTPVKQRSPVRSM